MSVELIISILSLCFTFGTLIFVIIIDIIRLKFSKSSYSTRLLLDMINEFRSAEFRKHRFFIKNKLSNNYEPIKGYYEIKNEEHRRSVTTVSHFFDLLGLLVNDKYIDEKVILKYMGEAIIDMWEILEPYIHYERNRNIRDYQKYFEGLTKKAKEVDISKLRRKYLD